MGNGLDLTNFEALNNHLCDVNGIEYCANTGKNSDWANAFGIYDGTTLNKAFLGWYESVGQKLSYDFSVQLWKKLDKNISVRNAALKAADAVPEYCPIRFRGNRNYNGYK